jgi:acyl-CoA thioesterase-1
MGQTIAGRLHPENTMTPSMRRARLRYVSGHAVLAGLLLLLAIGVAGCGAGSPKLPKLGANDVVLAFGDSLTYGTGATEAESYPAVLSGLIGRTVIREGVPGETTAQGMARLPSALERHRPKLVLLCLGGNDMLRKVDDATISANLREMIRRIQGSGAAVVLLGVPKPALFGGAAAYYEALAREFELVYEGDVIVDVLKKPAMKSDPIHPNAQGYKVVAEAVAALLKKSGAL